MVSQFWAFGRPALQNIWHPTSLVPRFLSGILLEGVTIGICMSWLWVVLFPSHPGVPLSALLLFVVARRIWHHTSVVRWLAEDLWDGYRIWCSPFALGCRRQGVGLRGRTCQEWHGRSPGRVNECMILLTDADDRTHCPQGLYTKCSHHSCQDMVKRTEKRFRSS
jgi:hypothetical protein